MHQTLAVLFQKKTDPYTFLEESWGMLKHIPIAYNQRESWDKLKASGKALLTKFINEELPKIGEVKAVERSFTLSVTSLDLPFVGVIDLVADVDSKDTVVDFKTAGSAPDEYEAHMSDQLTAYKMAEPQVEQLGLWVLVKTKEPQIIWQPTNRTGAQLGEYLAKAGLRRPRDHGRAILQTARDVVRVVRLPTGLPWKQAEGKRVLGDRSVVP